MFQVLVLVGVDFFPLQRLHELSQTGIVVGVRRPTHARNHVVLLEDGYIQRERIEILDPSDALGPVPAVGARWLAPAPQW